MVCHSLLQCTMFCKNSPLWPVCLGWPCTAWLIASLSYSSPFATTRLWSMKAGPKQERCSALDVSGGESKIPCYRDQYCIGTWNVKSRYRGKLAGKNWRQEEKVATEDETVGWHHCLDGHEFEQTLGDGGGQRSLACCNPWSHKESDTA